LVLAVVLSCAHRMDWSHLITLALGSAVGGATYLAAGWLSGVQLLHQAVEASGLCLTSFAKRLHAA